MDSAILTTRQIADIVHLCLDERDLRGRRDAALFAVTWCGQLSIPEAVRLQINAAERILAPCGGPFGEALRLWLQSRADIAGPFLLSLDRRGRLLGESMPATTASEIVRRRAAQAKAGYVTPKDLLRASVLSARRGPSCVGEFHLGSPRDDWGPPAP